MGGSYVHSYIKMADQSFSTFTVLLVTTVCRKVQLARFLQQSIEEGGTWLMLPPQQGVDSLHSNSKAVISLLKWQQQMTVECRGDWSVLWMQALEVWSKGCSASSVSISAFVPVLFTVFDSQQEKMKATTLNPTACKEQKPLLPRTWTEFCFHLWCSVMSTSGYVSVYMCERICVSVLVNVLVSVLAQQ